MYVIEYVNFGECVVIFDYGDGLNGLSYWGELNLEWVLCKVGNQQLFLVIFLIFMVIDFILGDLKVNYILELVDVIIVYDDYDFKVIIFYEFYYIKFERI